jgi:zinc and cadmium transporter
MNTLLSIFIANAAVSLLSLVGVFTLSLQKHQRKLTQYFVSFAAGVLLSSAFLNIIHEALEDQEPFPILLTILIGMSFSFLMERFVLWFHHHDDTHQIHPSAYLVIIGDAIHNFIDGLAIAATFLVNPAVGVATTFAVAAHEIPQEIADFSILTHSGFSKKRALLVNFLSALTAVIGGFIGYYFFNSFVTVLPYALAVSGGIFIYVATADLIPALHEEHSKIKPFQQVYPFILGILLMYILSTSVIHGH